MTPIKRLEKLRDTVHTICDYHGVPYPTVVFLDPKDDNSRDRGVFYHDKYTIAFSKRLIERLGVADAAHETYHYLLHLVHQAAELEENLAEKYEKIWTRRLTVKEI